MRRVSASPPEIFRDEAMSLKLSAAALSRLPNGVAAPKYSHADLKPGLFHIGVGNFHRAHQAVYLDELFNLGLSRDWGIVGTGVRAADAAMCSALQAQDWLTTVVEQEAHGATARVTAAMLDFVPPGDAAAALAEMVKPEIRIVSLTITEGGYYISPATQSFDPAHP